MSGSEGRGSMRDSMPEIAAWIDELRAAFGRAGVDRQIRRGLAGEPTFHVAKDGVTVVGTKIPEQRSMNATQWLHFLDTGERSIDAEEEIE